MPQLQLMRHIHICAHCSKRDCISWKHGHGLRGKRSKHRWRCSHFRVRRWGGCYCRWSHKHFWGHRWGGHCCRQRHGTCAGTCIRCGRCHIRFFTLTWLLTPSVGITVNLAALALSNTNALRSDPALLRVTLSFQSAMLDAHLLSCLCPGLLIGHDDVLFW